MAELKMPEINGVVIAGNLTKDPVFRQTNSGGTPVVNFSIACNRRFRDSNHQWQEDVCYVGVVAWNKLAESCRDNLKKSSAVLVDGELQSRTWKAQDGASRTVVEIKARRIQFLNKRKREGEEDHDGFIEDDGHETQHEDFHEEDTGHIYEYKYLSSD
ncbi:MAG: single-stranded DNA-binding protein [Candidatus Chlorobium antarcticum]|nr:single-stranded DNA-binding protein [Candidatus Chlorobium antarcticum]